MKYNESPSKVRLEKMSCARTCRGWTTVGTMPSGTCYKALVSAGTTIRDVNADGFTCAANPARSTWVMSLPPTNERMSFPAAASSASLPISAQNSDVNRDVMNSDLIVNDVVGVFCLSAFPWRSPCPPCPFDFKFGLLLSCSSSSFNAYRRCKVATVFCYLMGLPLTTHAPISPSDLIIFANAILNICSI